MADEKQLELIGKGVDFWNRWREEHPTESVNLRGASLRGAKLIGANLYKADLSFVNLNEAYLYHADLREANLCEAVLNGARLCECDLSGAYLNGSALIEADLSMADFSNAEMSEANLSLATLRGSILHGAILRGTILNSADFYRTDLSNADLTGADLRLVSLVETNVEQAILTNCKVYGLSAWALKGIIKDQSNLIITPDEEATITVDDLQVAQFIYLLLNNENIRNVIDTITSKVVLILGRFTHERKRVLDALRSELRKRNFTPLLFDFVKPTSKDLTGTVETLARMARFIIADLTDPSSIPHELATLVPHLRTTPIQLIRLNGSTGYGMIEDYYGSYQWLLKPYEYEDIESLITALDDVISPADVMAQSFRNSTF